MENPFKHWSKGKIFDQIRFDEANIEKILNGELTPKMSTNCLL